MIPFNDAIDSIISYHSKLKTQKSAQSQKDSIIPLGADSTLQASEVTHIIGPEPGTDIEMESYQSYREKQDKINSLPTDRERIIAWNKEFNSESTKNYVIIDKTDFSATIYTPDGQVVKKYEIGVAKNKTDALLKRSKRGINDFASTTAGIYTANYRASGRDGYAHLYGDRVLTLSNDGLKAKGVGNGETGVAIHAVPNGNQYRINLLNREGVSESNNRFSGGCVNMLPKDFYDCMENISGIGTKVYILPEDDNNYMCVKNNELHFTQRVYTGDVATTTTKNDQIKEISIETKPELSQEGIDMVRAIVTYKQELCQELKLDNDTYNEIALRALGIAGQETNFGSWHAGLSKGTPYIVKERYEGLVNFFKKLKGNNSYNSRGITQMKIESYTDPEVKDLFEKYNITADNVKNGKECAIGTMIVLSCMYKNELPALKEQIDKLGISPYDALLYCWNNHKNEIRQGSATPDTNIYIKNVRQYIQDFNMYQEI